MTEKTIKNCNLIKPVIVNENDNIIEVAKKLHNFQERRIFVVNSKKMPIGIISLVDINDRVVAKGLDLKKTKAKDIMSYPLSLVIDFNQNVNDVARKMIEKNNYYCPVIDKGVLKGVLTYQSLIKAASGK